MDKANTESHRKINDDRYDSNSKANYNKTKSSPGFNNLNHAMAYHTVQTKTICEKRDLNNVSFSADNSSKLENNAESDSCLLDNILFEDDKRSSISENGRIIDNNYQKDILFNPDSYNGECQQKEPSTFSTAKLSKSDKYKPSFFSSPLCKIDINTIICSISCVVSIYCVYSTFSLRFFSKVRNVRIVVNCKRDYY